MGILNDRLEKLFMAILFTLRVFGQKLEYVAEGNIFCIPFCLSQDLNHSLSSSTYSLLDVYEKA